MLKVVIIVVYQVITVFYAEPAIILTRHNDHSNYVTLNLTNSCSASADSVSYAEMTPPEAITMATTVTVTPTVEVTPSSTNLPTSGTYSKVQLYNVTIQQILPNQSALSDDGEKNSIIVSDLKIS